jgi:hypothetical protein
MRNFDDYKFICFTQGMNPEVIESCRKFVVTDHNYIWGSKLRDNANSDLGYAELADITNFNDSLKLVKECIQDSITDYDSHGRDLSKIRLRQLIKDPHKGILRLVLKSYYLFYFGIGDINA